MGSITSRLMGRNIREVEKVKITIYNPSIRMGGTNNLLANLAISISRDTRFVVHYIEYTEGATVDYVRQNSPDCNIICIGEKESITVDGGVAIMILLHAKLLTTLIKLTDRTKMIFWSTHPEDGIKLLPLFNFFYKKDHRTRKKVANLITPVQKRRTRGFISQGLNYNGIIWMDDHNYEVNNTFYDLGSPNYRIWPLVTSDPKDVQNVSKVKRDGLIKIVVLGRLCDFKVIPLLMMLPNLAKICTNIKLYFIGDGDYREILERTLCEYSLNYEFLGNISKTQLDRELVKYDLIIGMGTSVLEGAKLAIPSIVMNGAYNPKHLHAAKVDWLYNCHSYFVGEIIYSNKGSSGLKKDLTALIEEFINSNNDNMIGMSCYQHWRKFHSYDAFKERAASDILSCKFEYGDNKHFLKLTIVNRIVNAVKHIITNK